VEAWSVAGEPTFLKDLRIEGEDVDSRLARRIRWRFSSEELLLSQHCALCVVRCVCFLLFVFPSLHCLCLWLLLWLLLWLWRNRDCEC
jgi:hypothetical protein